MLSYYDELRTNPAFRAFVDAQIGQAAVELAALKVERQRDQDAIDAQLVRIRELEAQLDGGKTRKKR